MNPEQKEFMKIFNSLCYKYSLWELFNDFCEIATWNLRRSFYVNQEEEILKKFARFDEKYKQKEIDQFAKAFSLVVISLEREYHDFLGEVYMDMDLGKKQAGQFFTPQHLCDLMSQLQAGDIKQRLEENGYMTVSDPACGGGAMLIGFIKEAIKQGVNPSTEILLHAQDVDLLATQMCYIQMSLCGVACNVIHGNTLSMEIWSEYFTPVYFLNNWHGLISLNQTREQVKTLLETNKGVNKSKKLGEEKIIKFPENGFSKDEKGQYLLFG